MNLGDLIFDAEKRWAQSTYCKRPVFIYVIWSLMLKSVEHYSIFWKQSRECRVIWSLMLKSVEHWICFRRRAGFWCDLIFDAEKRWALLQSYSSQHHNPVIWSLMLKSVEHIFPFPITVPMISDLIFDAEKRWARLRSLNFRFSIDVIWSLMLKSVEHSAIALKRKGEGVWP